MTGASPVSASRPYQERDPSVGIHYKCEVCMTDLEVENSMAGKAVECHKCHNVHNVPLPDFIDRVSCPYCEEHTWDKLTQDEADNTTLQDTPLTIPVHMITQAALADVFLPPIQDAAPHATSADVPGAGHFLLHEAPDRVLAEINAFYPASTP